ncbi:MAG: UbiA family prenyltransferase [Candidatus ainarchaeum sp.]|nr:UbiA family prenyltransferase [Candidatus ainarchaeum sp.]
MRINDLIGLITPQYIPLALFGAFLGAVVTINKLPDQQFIILAIALTCIVAAFNTFNAVSDKEIDKINKPERPLVSGKITDTQAIILTIIFYGIAIILGLFLGTTTLIIILIATILTFLYSYKPVYLKKKFIIGNFSGAILYALLCPLAGWSLYPSNPMNTTIFFFLFVLGIGLSFVKDFEDLLGDGIHKVASLPVVIGKNQTTNLIILIEIFAFSIIAFAILSKTLNVFYSILLFVIIPLIFYTNKFRQTKNLVYDRQIFYKIVILILVCETIIIILNLI